MVTSPAAYDNKLILNSKIKPLFLLVGATDHFEFADIFLVKP